MRLEALIEEKYGRHVQGSEAAATMKAQGGSPQSGSAVMDQPRRSVSQDKDTYRHPVSQDKDTYSNARMSGVNQSSSSRGKVPCKWHQRGSCRFGVNCLYLHQSSTISPQSTEYSPNTAYPSNAANPSFSPNVANPVYSQNTAYPAYSSNTANPVYSHNKANTPYNPNTANPAFTGPPLMHDFSRPPPGFGPCTIPATSDSAYRLLSSQTSPSVHRPSALHSLPPPIPALQGTQRPLVSRPPPPSRPPVVSATAPP